MEKCPKKICESVGKTPGKGVRKKCPDRCPRKSVWKSVRKGVRESVWRDARKKRKIPLGMPLRYDIADAIYKGGAASGRTHKHRGAGARKRARARPCVCVPLYSVRYVTCLHGIPNGILCPFWFLVDFWMILTNFLDDFFHVFCWYFMLFQRFLDDFLNDFSMRFFDYFWLFFDDFWQSREMILHFGDLLVSTVL